MKKKLLVVLTAVVLSTVMFSGCLETGVLNKHEEETSRTDVVYVKEEDVESVVNDDVDSGIETDDHDDIVYDDNDDSTTDDETKTKEDVQTSTDNSGETQETIDDEPVKPLGVWKQELIVEYMDGDSENILSVFHEDKEIKAVRYNLLLDVADNLNEMPTVDVRMVMGRLGISGDVETVSFNFNGVVKDVSGFQLIDSFRLTSNELEDILPLGQVTINIELSGSARYKFSDTSYNKMPLPKTSSITVKNEIDYEENEEPVAEYYYDFKYGGMTPSYAQFLSKKNPHGTEFTLDKTTVITSAEYVIFKDNVGYVKCRDANSPSTAQFNVYVVDTTNPSVKIGESDGQDIVQTNPPLHAETITLHDISKTACFREFKFSEPVTLNPGTYAVLIEQESDGYYHISHSVGIGFYQESSSAIKGVHMLGGGVHADKITCGGDFAFRVWGYEK